MKKSIILLIVFLFIAVPAFAATNVSIRWNANTESDMAGYRIYRSAVSGSYDTSNLTGDITHPTVEFTENGVPDGTWFWVITAYDLAGNESVYSEETTRRIDLVAPAASGMVTVEIVTVP